MNSAYNHIISGTHSFQFYTAGNSWIRNYDVTRIVDAECPTTVQALEAWAPSQYQKDVLS